MQFQPVCTLPFVVPHPRPRFCLFRPDGSLAPLIPIDELPSWLQIGNWPPEMFTGLQPVSLSYIPREGEYKLICHNCSSSGGSLSKMSSGRNEDSQTPLSAASGGSPTSGGSAASAASQTQSCPGGFRSPLPHVDAAAAPKIPMALSLSMLAQSPFHTPMQAPLPGTYGVNVPPMTTQFVPSPAMQIPFPPGRSSTSSSDRIPASLQKSFEQSSGNRSDCSATSAHSICSSTPLKAHDAPDLPNEAELDELAVSKSELATEIKMAAVIANTIQRTLSLGERSVASTRSLTAAVELLKRRLSKKVSDQSDCENCQCEKDFMELGSRPPTPAPFSPKRKRSSKYNIRVPSPAHRRAKFRRRRRADKTKSPKVPIANCINIPDEGESKPEQTNSATKRRDRRERLAERLNHSKRDVDSKNRYWHMMMIPNWRANVTHN